MSKISILKWIGTICVITSGLLGAMVVMPLNFIVGSFGALSWLIVGFIWQDRAVITMNVVMLSLAVIAVYTNW